MIVREKIVAAGRLGFSAAGALAGIGMIGIGLSDPPYIDGGGISGWGAVFAIGTFAALMAIPFWLQSIRLERRPSESLSWDWSLAVWGALSAAVLVGAFALGLATGFSGSTLAGTAAIVLAGESALIVGVLGFWIMFGG